MAVPTTNIDFSDIQTEFGGSNPINLSEYYAGGSYVPAGTFGINGLIPSSGEISLNSFAGAPMIRVLMMGGHDGTAGQTNDTNTIYYINYPSMGTFTHFGNLSVSTTRHGVAGSSVYLIVYGVGSRTTSPTSIVTTERILISTLGNSSAYGNLSQPTGDGATASSQTRAIHARSLSSGVSTNTLYSSIIATLGNFSSHGTLSSNTFNTMGAVNSPTRAVFRFDLGSKKLEYITIESGGSATNFGTLSSTIEGFGSVCSSTRGVFAGGSTAIQDMDYITIASAGNGTSFGNLSVGRTMMGSATAKTMGIFVAGRDSTGASTLRNVVDEITIASTGNAVSYGSGTYYRSSYSIRGGSNAHGGL